MQLAKTVCLSVSILVGLYGCSGLHLHNSADQELSKKAAESFKSADVSSIIDTRRKTIASLLERDLELSRRSIKAERDAALIAALADGQEVSKITSYVNDRLKRIGMPVGAQTQKALHNLAVDEVDALEAREVYVMAALRKDIAPPSFPPSNEDELAAHGSKDATIVELFDNYKATADDYIKGSTVLRSQPSGLLREVTVKIDQALALHGQLKVEASKLKKELEASLQDYKTQSGLKTDKIDLAKSKVDAALKAFDNAILKVEPAAKTLGLEDLLAELHLEKLRIIQGQVKDFLDTFAEAAGQEKIANEPFSDVAIAGKASAILVHAAKEVEKSSVQAKLVPLIFEQENLRHKIEYQQRKHSRGMRRLELLQQYRQALLAEAFKLQDVLTQLDKAGTKGKIDLQSPGIKAAVIPALFTLADSIAIDKLRQDSLDLNLISLDHQEVLDASEYALNLWVHMITAPIEQLAGYHSSGLKSEDIANLIHAAGLTGIAVGVNR